MGFTNKYATGALLGSGSVGSVYHARDIVLDRDVALKILHLPGDLDPEIKERFYREARISANIRHPNVVLVHEIEEHNGVPFVAMELLNGAGFRRHIAERRPMSLAQKVELFAQICDGLAEAHRRGIVHRDIKPSNIFLHEKMTAKILDFGLAGAPSSKPTTAGRVLGTPNYMAPEQINRTHCDSRSDLFSAAIVFFEFLVYAHPFQSSFIPRRIVVDGPDSLSDCDPLIPRSLADLLQRALQKRPENRLQTAEEFAAGLRAVLQEMRTGLPTESVIQDLSAVEPPRSAPSTDESPDSPAARLASFVQMLRDFEGAIQATDLTLARAVLGVMVRLEAVDDRFSEALSECRNKMDRLQNAAPPAVKAAVAAAGTSYSPPHSESSQVDPARIVLTADSPEHQPEEDFHARSISNHHQPSALFCDYCGASNLDTAVFCHNCASTIVHPRHAVRRPEGPAEVVASTLRKLKGRLQDWQVVLSRRTREVLGFAKRVGKKASDEFLALPRNAQYAVGGLLAVALAATAILIVVGPSKPVLIETALGTATVQSAQTPLLESDAPSSKSIEVLQRGTELNVLSHIKEPGQRLVRVQVVTPRPRRAGFVALSDVGHLSSGDPAVAWEFLGLGRSAAEATPEAARKFSQALTEFSGRFPGTTHALVAALEQVQIHLRLAKEAQAAGKARTEWEGDLDQARKAMDAAGIREPGTDEEKRLFATPADFATWVYKTRTKQLLDPLKEIRMLEPPAVQAGSAGGADGPAQASNPAELAALLRKTSSAWHSGDLDACEMYAKQALTLAPDNRKAKAWLWQVKEARKQ